MLNPGDKVKAINAVSKIGMYTEIVRDTGASASDRAKAKEVVDRAWETLHKITSADAAKRKANPVPRSSVARKKYINRDSQISHATAKGSSASATARLKKRRAKNTEQGYFPNPIADKIALHFNAGNNASGNPRRIFVVVDTGGNLISTHDENYDGRQAVTGHYPGIAIVGQFAITPAQYRELKARK